jgi:hypothetical protein
LQEGDPYPEWPEDAEAPEGQSEAAFRMAAAETIKGRGNELFKLERHREAIAKYNKVLLRCMPMKKRRRRCRGAACSLRLELLG